MDQYMSECQGFSFNSKHSSEFEGIIIADIKRPLLAKMRVSEITVPNRNSSYKFENGYEDKNIEMTIIFLEEDNKLRKLILRDLIAWLYVEGKIIFDDEKDVYYKGRLYNQVLSVEIANMDSFTLIFTCDPFKYSVYLNEDVNMSTDIPLYEEYPLEGLKNTFDNINEYTECKVFNLGTTEADSIIEIDGSATTVEISSSTGGFSIQNVDSKVYVDTKNMLCYTKDSLEKKINKLKDFEGTFPKIQVGENTFTVQGTNINVSVFFNYKNAYL